MMKRQQILCDRCCREQSDELTMLHDVEIVVRVDGNLTRTIRHYDDLCARCIVTLDHQLSAFFNGYTTTRAKLTGGDAVETES